VWIPELAASIDGINPPGRSPDPTDPSKTIYTPSAMVMVVNGVPYPQRSVCADTYRLRLLNGCNARQLVLYLSSRPPIRVEVPDPTGPPTPYYVPDPKGELLDMTVIGNEGGFFAQPVSRTFLTVGGAERFDVLIDFAALPPGVNRVYLNNMGSEGPFGGPYFPGPFPGAAKPTPDDSGWTVNAADNPGVDLTEHTAQIMLFDLTPTSTDCTTRKSLVNDLLGPLQTTLADLYKKEVVPELGSATNRREFTLSEARAGNPDEVLIVQLGDSTGPRLFGAPITTNPDVNRVEEWTFINTTPDTHPIHIHERHFQVVARLNRTTLVPLVQDPSNPTEVLSTPCEPGSSAPCNVLKDTVLVTPESRVTIRFNTGNRAGLYVWHCHLLEHEDNEMMLPWCIGKVTYKNPKTNTPMCPGV
jgi:bilirubin oxidase